MNYKELESIIMSSSVPLEELKKFNIFGIELLNDMQVISVVIDPTTQTILLGLGEHEVADVANTTEESGGQQNEG